RGAVVRAGAEALAAPVVRADAPRGGDGTDRPERLARQAVVGPGRDQEVVPVRTAPTTGEGVYTRVDSVTAGSADTTTG
ncbi:hypothetical protein K4H02_27445, partial [Mycobacterium tuberculosis]|nr:hypothetical protein [Mycobacterium tuberculosis]